MRKAHLSGIMIAAAAVSLFATPLDRRRGQRIQRSDLRGRPSGRSRKPA